MTHIQFEHQMEQFEAMRRDFALLWRLEEPKLRRLKFSKMQLYAAEQIAWNVFVKAGKR